MDVQQKRAIHCNRPMYLQRLLCRAARLGLQLALLETLDELLTLVIAFPDQSLLLPHQPLAWSDIAYANREPSVGCMEGGRQRGREGELAK